MPITAITEGQREELSGLHREFGDQVRLTGCSTAAASFLIIGALIVITCGSLCLMLPGVNVINHVVLPALLPGGCGLLLAVPLIVVAVKKSRQKNQIRERMILRMVALMEVHDLPRLSCKKRIEFILHNYLQWPLEGRKLLKNTGWTDDYQKKIINDLKEKIGKKKEEQNPRQKRVAKALDKALIEIQAKKRR